mgnify:CR=1 FL=1
MAPSTNTIVQPDFDDMRPRGVTFHYSRIFTPNAKALSNDTFRAGVDTIGSNVIAAIAPPTSQTSEREYWIYAQILSGNVPSWLRTLKPVTVTYGGHTATYYVTPDFLAIETGYFGFVLDVKDIARPRFGFLEDNKNYATALAEGVRRLAGRRGAGPSRKSSRRGRS